MVTHDHWISIAIFSNEDENLYSARSLMRKIGALAILINSGFQHFLKSAIITARSIWNACSAYVTNISKQKYGNQSPRLFWMDLFQFIINPEKLAVPFSNFVTGRDMSWKWWWFQYFGCRSPYWFFYWIGDVTGAMIAGLLPWPAPTCHLFCAQSGSIVPVHVSSLCRF